MGICPKLACSTCVVCGPFLQRYCNWEFLSADDNKRPPLPEHWNKSKVTNVFAVNVPPWWDHADTAVVFASCTKNREVFIYRMRFNMGEMRTATWRITWEDLASLPGMVFHGVIGKHLVTIVSESQYVAQKDMVSAAIKSPPQQGQPTKLTLKGMDDAMSLDSEDPSMLNE